MCDECSRCYRAPWAAGELRQDHDGELTCYDCFGGSAAAWASLPTVDDLAEAMAMARAVIDAAISEGRIIDRDALQAAADVLAGSVRWQDINRVCAARNALWASRGSELLGETAGIAARLADPGIGRLAPNFAAANAAREPVPAARIVFGIAIAALAAVCAINIAMAAPGKIARTVALHHMIEEPTNE